MTNETWEPDYLDLFEWIVWFHDDVYQATRYLVPHKQYGLWSAFWENQGRPDTIKLIDEAIANL